MKKNLPWETVHLAPGRVRLRNQGLSRRTLPLRLIREALSLLPGVVSVQVRVATGGVLIQYNPYQAALPDILDCLEQCHSCLPPETFAVDYPDRDLLTKSSLVLTTALSEFVYPPLLPLAAAVVLASGSDALEKTARKLLAKEVGPEAVESALTLLALYRGDFFSGALMTLLLDFWPHVWADDFLRLETSLRAAAGQTPHDVCLCVPQPPGGGGAPSDFSRKAALPLLALSGLTLLTRGPKAAQAVIRPDYDTGLTMIRRLSVLQTMTELVRQGIRIGREADLETLLKADVMVIHWDGNGRGRSWRASIPAFPGARTVLVAEGKIEAVRKEAKRIGVELYMPEADAATRKAVIGCFRQQGNTVCYLRDEGNGASAGKEADLIITFGRRKALPGAPPAGEIFCPETASLADLLHALERHRNRIADGNRHLMIPNLVAVAGALFAGFPPIASVLLSNLGILAAYLRVERKT